MKAFFRRVFRRGTRPSSSESAQSAELYPTAKAAKNATQLHQTKANTELSENIESAKGQVFLAIRQAIRNGKMQTKIAVINEQLEIVMVEQIPFAKVETPGIIALPEICLGEAARQYKAELNSLGYNVIIRNLNIQYKRLLGDAITAPLGHELHITWHD
jgi:hypothetical protein